MNKRHVLLLTAVLGMASAQAQTSQAQTSPTATKPGATSSIVTNAVKDANLTDRPITFNAGNYAGPLSILLTSVAKSAGYEVVFNFNVDATPLIDGEIASGTSSVNPNLAYGATGNPNGNAVAPASNTDAGTAPAAPATTATPAAPALTDTKPYASATGKPQELSAKPIAYNFVNKPFNEVWPLLMDVYELDYEVVKLGNGTVIRISQRPALSVVKLNNLQADDVIRRLGQFYGTEILDTTRHPTGKYVFDSPSMRASAGSSAKEVVIGGTTEEIKKMTAFLTQMDGTATAGPTQAIYNVKGQQGDIISLLSAQFPSLKVTPVGQTGQLVLNGNNTQINDALTLLAKVDQNVPSTTQKVFQLVNASAEELKATLEGTLSRDMAQQASGLTPGATVLDPTTGQPYVSGPLVNAPLTQNAASAAPAGTAATPAGTPAATAAAGTATSAAVTPPVSIIADKRTNTLIVRGTPSQVDQVAQLIPQLDKVVPQINVQVRIQEVTESALKSLGMDWNANFGGFKVSVGGSGLGASFDPTRTLVGFNVFPTLNALETQSLSKKVYDGSITMQSGQRSLGSGASQNASSDAAATVKSGGKLDINIPSSAANVPAITKTVDYGVVLDFFDPQVAPDGTITLRVHGQVNDLLTNVPDNGVGVPNILRFTNSEAQSIITFKSGQTVLLSGLMGSKSTSQSSGVPYLSTIPVVGSLFGKQSKNSESSQLLVVVTGTVVQ